MWSWGQARQERGQCPVRKRAQALCGRGWEGKNSAESISSSCCHTEGSEDRGTSSANLCTRHCAHSALETQLDSLARTRTVTSTARLSGKDGDYVPRPSLRQGMVASRGTGSSLGDHSGWIKVSGFVVSHRRDQAKEASVQPHRIGG